MFNYINPIYLTFVFSFEFLTNSFISITESFQHLSSPHFDFLLIMTTYKIVAEHYAFDGPVRSICIGPLGEIVAGNQSDSPSVKRWMFKDKFHFEQVGDSLFHDHWVVAVTSLPPGKNPAFPDGCIVTGCMDSKIRIFDSIGNPIHEIIGHEKGVISFSWTSTGDLISGSWDGTARLWSLEQSSMTQMVQSQCKFILGSHENGVHVLGLPDGRIVTTSTGEAVNEKPANFKVIVTSYILHF